jgi:hypothetical protein
MSNVARSDGYGVCSLDRDNSVGIATRCGLLGPGIESCRSQWPRGLRCRSAAARLLRLRVRIPPGAWMFVLCVLSEDNKAKCRTVNTKKQVWCTREFKKSRGGFLHPSRLALGPPSLLYSGSRG